jgi:hypothetical protein
MEQIRLTVAKEISKYKLDLVGVQEVRTSRWVYIFLEDHKRIISAVKRVECVRDRIYI